MAAPGNVHELEATLKMFNIKFSVDSNDVQKWDNMQYYILKTISQKEKAFL